VKVVYDISILSHGFRSEPARTGIFRVVDRTARGLRDRGDIELELSSAESWENLYWAERFAAGTPGYTPASIVPRGLASRSLFRAQDYLYGLGSAERKSFPSRAIRRAVKRLSGAITSRTSSLPASSLEGRDIFHSGFHGFPGTTANVKGLRRFLTVYDLIPVLHPQFFADGIAVIIREIFITMLQSIQPTDYVLAISEATKGDLCSLLPIDPSHVFVVPLAASEDLFFPVSKPERITQVKERYGIPRSGRYLLSVNTLEPRKNMAHALRCFASMVKEQRIEDLFFVLVGTRGWDFQSILAAIADSELAPDRVILAGYVPDEDLAALYSGALAFVYPSFYEGFGLPPLEAMQCGTPVITSNTSSLPEVVGDAGIMVSPTDADALSQAMLDLYSQAGVYRSLSARSLARARQFSWKRYADDVVASYRIALGE
jgi:glycosyltransferase involved in cell wall biosynthesis